MQRWEETRRMESVAIASLIVSDTFEDRLQQQHVRDLADSIRVEGLIHPPMVRVTEHGNEVVAGEDRVAAHVLLGRDEVTCIVSEHVDEARAERLRHIENVYRRTDPEERRRSVAALVALEAERVADGPADEALNPFVEEAPPPKKRGRPKSPKGQAREQVAKDLGMSPEAVRMAERRGKQLDAPKPAPLQTDLVCPVENQGIETTSVWNAQVEAVRVYLRDLNKLLVQAQGVITNMRNANLPVRESAYQRVQELMHDAAASVRSMKPKRVCPYCKLVASIQPTCAACFGYGYTTEAQEENIPPELLEDASLVCEQGEYRKVLRAGTKAPETPRVEGTDDEALSVEHASADLEPEVEYDGPAFTDPNDEVDFINHSSEDEEVWP